MTDHQKLFLPYRKWRTVGLVDEDGIIVASDHQQEWLLPWWWENYCQFNSHPVAFVDFGMSKEMRTWCEARGEVIDLVAVDDFVGGKLDMDPVIAAAMQAKSDEWCLPYRNVWFKKPLACLQSPYRRSIWIDLDCQVLGSLEQLFELYGQSLALTREEVTYASYPDYNSGVIVFKHGLPILKEWADLSIEQNRIFRGDQDILSWIIHQKKSVIELPAIYNWSRRLEKNPQAVVIHWHGPQGKSCIQHQIMRLNLQSLIDC
jgi:hypothetical protein